MANVDEAAMQCSICRHAVVPAIVRAVQESESAEKAEEVVESALRPLSTSHAFDAVSKTTSVREQTKLSSSAEEAELDQHIHEYVEHLLFDTHHSQSLYSLVYDWHHAVNRRHLFPRLVEYLLCHCPGSQDIGPHDMQFSKFLSEHMVSRNRVIKKYGGHDAHNVDQFDSEPTRGDL